MDEEQGKMLQGTTRSLWHRPGTSTWPCSPPWDLAAAASPNDEGVVDATGKMIPTFTPTRKNLKV